MTTDTQDQTNEEKVQAQITRLETILPRLIDTLFDIVDGRKFIAVVTTKTPDGEFVSMLEVTDNSDAPPVDDSAPTATTYDLNRATEKNRAVNTC